MAPIRSVDGWPTNWVNYKTGLKGVQFKMHADNRRASIAIELTQPDADVRELFYEQFLALRTLLHEALGEEWTWEAEAENEHGQPLSRIYKELAPANVFNREDWPALISFLKPRIIALDTFWQDSQYAFEELREW
jgi:hypothetical protein